MVHDESMTSPDELAARLEQAAADRRIPLLGWVPVARYEERFPGAQLDSYVPGAASLVLFGVGMLDGEVDTLMQPRPRFISEFWANATPRSFLPALRHPTYLLKQLVKRKISDFGNRYHFFEYLQVLTSRVNREAEELAAVVEQAGHRALPVDPCKRYFLPLTGLLSLKHAAVLAGLGRMGKHQQLIAPGLGTRVWLGGLITSAELPERQAEVPPPCCDGCDRCVQICDLARRAGGFTFSTHACTSCARCLAVCPGGRAAPAD